MNSLVRASKEALKAGARGFAAAATPDRKVAVLGAAGEPDPDVVMAAATAIPRPNALDRDGG